ncbi:MAG TPA: hypothetical protein VN539_00415, partial [Candidatus Saccharimonadales bacterium]|nr:hypothetical protein [Candidatus Saccharimonadales bacterium]
MLPTLALLLALGSATPVMGAVTDSTTAAADTSASLPRSPDTWSDTAASRHSLLSRKDVWFAARTVGAVVLATKLDRWAAEEAPE